MKNIFFIVILSAATLLLILILDNIFSEDSKSGDKGREEESISTSIEALTRSFNEPTVENFRYIFEETIRNDAGDEIRVPSVSFKIGTLTREESNELKAVKIEFEFYDKSRQDRPLQERVIAKGSSERAKLFSTTHGEADVFDLEFKSEFILEERVIIHTFDGRTGARSFTIEADNLIFQNNRFDSTERVRISREGLVILGEGLTFDMNSSFFTLHRNIRIDGQDFDFSRMMDGEAEAGLPPEEAGAPPAEAGTPPGETPGQEKPPDLLTITAAGPLRLTLSDATRLPVQGTGTGPVDEAGPKRPSNRLEIENDVVILKDDISCQCQAFDLEFTETPEGKTRILSLTGTGTGKDTGTRVGTDADVGKGSGAGKETRAAIQAQGYDIFCDRFQYFTEEELFSFRLLGRPEINNVAIPLFSAKGEGKGRSLLTFRCKGALEIQSQSALQEVDKTYKVDMTDEVVILDTLNPEPPVIKADHLSFVIFSQGQADQPPGADKAAPSFTMEEFSAQGHVAGRIQSFDLACADLKYDYVETPQGTISRLDLVDETESRLSSEEFSLFSPIIHISLHPGITEIEASRTFSLTSKVDNLPPIGSLSLLPGAEKTGQPEEKSSGSEEKTAHPEEMAQGPEEKSGRLEEGAPASPEEPAPTGGTIQIEGTGDFRLLVHQNEAAPHQNITLKNGPFALDMKRGEEKVIHIEGDRAFTLDLKSNQLSSMEFEGKGIFDCPELGFHAAGDALSLTNTGGETMSFFTKGPRGTAQVSFRNPGDDQICTIDADRVDMLLSDETRLDARDNVVAHIPLSFFRDQGTGRARVQCRTLGIDFLDQGNQFELEGHGSVLIQSDDMGLDSKCDTFRYNSLDEVLSLESFDSTQTVIKIRSPHDPSIHDSVMSEKVDINLRDSKIIMNRGGLVILNPYSKERGTRGRIKIQCKNEIALKDELLEFKGPVALEYSDVDGDPRKIRTMDCGKLWIYFTQSPLLAKLTSMDFDTYKTLVKENNLPPEEEDSNMIKRLKAQDNIVLTFDKYLVDCNLLSWNLLNDEILCEGRGGDVLIRAQDNLTIQGQKIRISPVREEISVIKD